VNIIFENLSANLAKLQADYDVFLCGTQCILLSETIWKFRVIKLRLFCNYYYLASLSLERSTFLGRLPPGFPWIFSRLPSLINGSLF